MNLDVIKKINLELAAVKEELAAVKETRSKVVTVATSGDDKEFVTRAASFYLLKQITGKTDVASFGSLKSELETRAIVPTDLDKWLAEQFTNDLIERMTLLGGIPTLFSAFTIPDSVQSLSVPQKTAALKAYLIAPAQDAIQSLIGSAKITFEAKRLVTLAISADQANDETVVATIELIKNDIAKALVNALENTIINGDTSTTANINGDTVQGSNNDQLKTFDGLRRITEDRNATTPSTLDFGGTVTLDKLVTLRAMMGKEGLKQSDLVYIMSPAVYFKLLATGTLPEMLTVDKYGASATVLTGEVAKIHAIPVIVSEFVTETLGADGHQVDGTDGEKSVILLVNRTMFATASRGTARYEQDRNIISATNIFTGFRDVDFKELTKDLSIVSSTLGYNIDV